MEPLGDDHQQWHRDAHSGKYNMERQRHTHLGPRGKNVGHLNFP